jgi:hypothetical protein
VSPEACVFENGFRPQSEIDGDFCDVGDFSCFFKDLFDRFDLVDSAGDAVACTGELDPARCGNSGGESGPIASL